MRKGRAVNCWHNPQEANPGKRIWTVIAKGPGGMNSFYVVGDTLSEALKDIEAQTSVGAVTFLQVETGKGSQHTA